MHRFFIAALPRNQSRCRALFRSELVPPFVSNLKLERAECEPRAPFFWLLPGAREPIDGPQCHDR